MVDKKESFPILMYQTEDGQTKLEVFLKNDNAWLTQKMMAELFKVTVPTINEHIKNIFDEGELTYQATVREFLIVQNDTAESKRLKNF